MNLPGFGKNPFNCGKISAISLEEIRSKDWFNANQ
jgi:hypothetical protein